MENVFYGPTIGGNFGVIWVVWDLQGGKSLQHQERRSGASFIAHKRCSRDAFAHHIKDIPAFEIMRLKRCLEERGVKTSELAG